MSSRRETTQNARRGANVCLALGALGIACSGKAALSGRSADAGSSGAQGLAGASASGGGAGHSPADAGADAVANGAAAGMGGDTSNAGASGEPGASYPDAAMLCKRVTTTLCARAPQCSTGPEQAVCESQLSLEFGCDWAASADYGACLQDGAAQTCDALFPAGDLTLPDSCLPPITATPLSDAQTKCYALVDALCAHSIQCLGRIITGSYLQDCEDDVTTNLQLGLPCLLAQSVGAGYAQCVASIPSLACGNAAAGGGTGGGTGGGAGNSGTVLATIPACADAVTFAP